MDRRFLAIIAVIIIVVAGIFFFTSRGNSNGSPASNAQPTNHVEGQGSTGVKLVEYGDYECPYCGQYYPVVKQVESEYDKLITFQFRNFPLTQIHQNAFAGARAAEAAALQNKFWQMHDQLYQDQNTWSSASDPTKYFDRYAQQLGLNVAKFKRDYASEQVNNTINADMSAGNKLGVNATPTFFLDGVQIQPTESASSFETLLNTEIKKKTGHDSGITPSGSSSTAAPQSTQ